ncbi:hypothetical protein DFJ74DRAFT_711784 [Hyaloraphidium curvatum]|nr:hypothetical protein DFJ74DRAFT_711784 [Hyaloraphidium curvatum]
MSALSPLPLVHALETKLPLEQVSRLATPPLSVRNAHSSDVLLETESEASLVDKLETMGVKWIRIAMLNLNNIMLSVSVPLFRLPKLATTGLGKPNVVYQQPLCADLILPGTGVGATGEMNFLPDLETLRVLPYEDGVACVIGEVWDYTPDGGKVPASFCPRNTLKKQLELLKSKYGLEPIVGMEIEFTLFDGFDADGLPKPVDEYVYCQDAAYRSLGGKCVREIVDTLASVGITPYTFHPESAPGAYEVSLAPVPMLRAADDLLFLRQTVDAIAGKHGLGCTLLPKPFKGEQGNGLHIHMSLVDASGINIFPDPSSAAGMSKTAECFMAGIMEHLPAIAGVTMPTINSYARATATGAWSGCTAVTWGRENRECTLRVSSPPYGTRCDNVEIRAYDSTANPYVGLAAFLASGMDGLARGLELPPETTDEPKNAVPMPKTLEEALANLAEDTVLRETLGETGMLYHQVLRKVGG